jgi:hypothetical protein
MSKELTPSMAEYHELMQQLNAVNNLVLSKLTLEQQHEERVEQIRERNEDHAQKYGVEPINPEADIDIPAIDDELGI